MEQYGVSQLREINWTYYWLQQYNFNNDNPSVSLNI